MGEFSGDRRFERAMRFGTQLLGQQTLDEAQGRGQNAEAQLAEMERMLGTPEQVRGELGYDANLIPYQGRFTLDKGAASGISATRYGVPYSRFEQSLTEANDLMARAEQAARDGDFAAARSLRAAAENATQLGPGYKSATYQTLGEPFAKSFRFSTEPALLAAREMSSPTARLVGGMVQDARELQDPSSPAYERAFGALTSGQLDRIEAERVKAERGLTSEYRAAEAERRDLSAARGAARGRFGEQALATRAAESAATARANIGLEASAQASEVMGQASEFLTSWTRDFARDTAGFAQAWLQNEPGVRKAYLDRLDNVSYAALDFYNQLNARATQRLTALDEMKSAERMSKLSAIVTGVTAAFGFGLQAIGAAGGFGALGSMISSGFSGVMDRIQTRNRLQGQLERASSGVDLGGRWGASPALSESIDVARYPLLSGARRDPLAGSLIPESATQLLAGATSASRF